MPSPDAPLSVDAAPRSPAKDSARTGAFVGLSVQLVASVLLLANSFLPWYNGGFPGYFIVANGWHQTGVATWAVVAVVLVTGVISTLTLRRAAWVAYVPSGLAICAFVLGAVFMVTRFKDGFLVYGVYIGAVGLLALLVGAILTIVASARAASSGPALQPVVPGVPAASIGHGPGGQTVAPPYAYARPTNGFAIASMVLGILGVSLLAIVFGHVALSQIKRSGQAGRGMAIAGLVLGYLVVILTITAVAAILVAAGNT